MNSFKKGLACVLAVLLLIGSLPIIGFAAPIAVDGQTIELDETWTVYIDQPGQVVQLNFTPEVSAVYTFYSFDSDGDPLGYIVDPDGTRMRENDDGGAGNNFEMSAFMSAGETYQLCASMFGERTGSYSVTVEEQSEYEYRAEGENATIIGYNGAGGEVVIPDTLDGYSVTGIDMGAFWDTDLTAVQIPDTVSRIAYQAFANCNQLTEVYLPNTAMTIEDQVFECCNNLKTVFYSGSREECDENLWISYDNWYLTSAKWVYNSCSLGEHEFDDANDVTCNNCPYTLPVYHSIALNETKPVTIENTGDEMLFRFTPDESGLYSFFSSNNTVDSYGYITDANGRQLASDDDGGDDRNFNVVYNLYAGETYILAARCLSDGVTGSFDVTLKRMEIVSVDFRDTEIIAGANASTQLEYDSLTDSYVPWEYYDASSYRTSYTITLSDGSTVEGFGDVSVGGTHLSMNYADNQSYDNQWELGGTYKVYVSLMGGAFVDEYNVTLVESPIVGFQMEPKTFMEYTNGGWYSDSLYDENDEYIGESPEYFSYDYHPYGISYVLKDGTVWSSDWYRFEWNGNVYYLDWDVDQSYENQWTVGNTYTVQASIAGFDFSYDIEIVGSPVVSVTASSYQMYENSSGHYRHDWYWDAELQEEVSTPEYFCYHSSPRDMVITLNDGTVIEGNYFEWNGLRFEVGYYESQSYENRWLAGNTYEVTAEIAGFEFTYEVEILKSPVVSISIPKVVLIEGADGHYTNDWRWDSELQQDVLTPEYFYYQYGARDFTVTMQDGTVYTNEGVWWNGEMDGLSCSADQNYENQWTVGNTYTATAEVFGFRTTYEIEIVPNPIASLIVEDQIHTEHTNGRWTTDSLHDEYGNYIGESPEYFEYWVNPEGCTVLFTDGTSQYVRAGEGLEISGRWYYLDWGSDQSYDNQWGVGAHTAWARFGGAETTYTVEIAALTSNDRFEYTFGNGGVIITNTLTREEVLEIPSEIDGVPVVGVANVEYCSSTKELIIPDSVRTIGDYVLWNLPVLEKVTFGSGVNNLAPNMFSQSFCLNEIVVSEDNPYFCVGANGVVYDKNMTTFIAYPVGKNERLEYTVPNTVVNLDALNYDIYCYVTVVYSPNHPLYVTVDGVTYTKDMTEIISCSPTKEGEYVMPETVTTIDWNAFNGCEGLTKVVVSPNVTEIVYYAFSSCSSLAEVQLPEGLVSIGFNAFSYTPSLESIDLPSTLEEIHDEAFYRSGLTSLSVPDSVYSIGDSAFEYVPIAELDLGNGVTHIGSNAFAEAKITSLVLPDSLTSLGYGAFTWCFDLTSVKIGSGLTYIPSSAFSRAGFTSIEIPNTITQIGEYAFGSTALQSIVLPESVEYVGVSAFAYSQLTSVEFKNPAVYLDDKAFCGCPLKSLQLGDQLERVGEYTFAETDITEIDIPDSVTSIVYGAFAGCEYLADIRIPTTVEDIGGHTFDGTAWYNAQADGVTYLGHIAYDWKGDMAEDTAVALKEGTTVIADYAFQHQANMTSITLPSSLRVIGEYAFYGCENVTSIHIPANVVEIGYQAFTGCMSVESVTVDPANEYFAVIDGALYTQYGQLVFDPAEQSAVRNVYINGWPDKRVYTIGEAFDPTGMGLMVYYHSGYRTYITEGFTIVGFDSSTPGEKLISVIYEGCEIYQWDRFYVTVTDEGSTDPDHPVVPDPEPEVRLEKISVSQAPTKTVYTVGEEFDSTGMLLTLYYSDGTIDEITEGFEIGGFDSSAAGDCWPSVSYGGITLWKVFCVVIEESSVVEPPVELTDITVTSNPYQTEYEFGEALDLTGLTLQLNYSDGTFTLVDEGYTVSAFDPMVVGEQVLTIDYEGFTTTITVTVLPQVVLSKVTLGSQPNKVEYEVGDGLDLTGLTLQLDYSDGSVKFADAGFTVYGYDPSVVGEQVVNVQYKGFIVTFTVTVREPKQEEPTAPQFVVENVTAKAGDTIVVPVKVVNNPGIMSAKLAIGYDADVLELMSAEWKDFTGGASGFGPTTANPFIANWADSLSGNNTTDGVFVLLTFKVKDSAAAGDTAITVSYDPDDVYDENWDNIAFETVSGTVTIIEYISGDVNDDGKVNNKDLGLLLQHLNGWSVNVVELACDVTRDGKVNNKDLGILLQYLNGWPVELK